MRWETFWDFLKHLWHVPESKLFALGGPRTGSACKRTSKRKARANYMPLFVVCVAFVLLVLPTFGNAGGISWVVHVTEYTEPTPGYLRVQLQLTQPSTAPGIWKSCRPLSVHIAYKGEPWNVFQPQTWITKKTWSKNVTEEKHLQAVQFLKEAWRTGRKIRFGYMSNGLVPTSPNTPCEVRTRGILLHDGPAIMAHHGRI